MKEVDKSTYINHLDTGKLPEDGQLVKFIYHDHQGDQEFKGRFRAPCSHPTGEYDENYGGTIFSLFLGGQLKDEESMGFHLDKQTGGEVKYWKPLNE